MAFDTGVLEAIDLAYQAAMEPGLWSAAVAAVTKVLGGERALVLERAFVLDRGPRRFEKVVCAAFDAQMVRDYFGAFEAINPIQASMNQIQLGRTPFRPVTTDQSWVEKGELVASDFYEGFFRPIDSHGVMLVQLSPEWHSASLNVLRSRRSGEFETRELELARAMHRPLCRAWGLSGRLSAERQVGESLAELAERTATAVLLVDGSGRVMHANPAAEALLRRQDGLWSRPEGLRGSTPEVSRRLAELISQAVDPQAGPDPGGALPLPRAAGARPLAALIAPAKAECERLALVSVIDPDASVRAPEERLRALFGLTAAEALVVAELAAGHEPKTIAERLGLSANTVAVHIARAKAKTETSRQAELVTLVLRISGL